MRAVFLIPAGVAVILFVVYLVSRRDDEDDHDWAGSRAGSLEDARVSSRAWIDRFRSRAG
jgi:hypothetical protein